MKVVFIAPHPDDIEVFAGGAAIKHHAGGDETIEILLTRGEFGAISSWIFKSKRKSLAEQRWREAQEGASILGIGELKFLGFVDREVGGEGVSEKIKKAVEAENPDLIYAPEPEFSYYKHPDHLAAGRVIRESFTEVPIRFYHTTKPNLEIDIRDVFERKVRALEAHRSQRFIILWWKFFGSRLYQRGEKVECFRQKLPSKPF